MCAPAHDTRHGKQRSEDFLRQTNHFVYKAGIEVYIARNGFPIVLHAAKDLNGTFLQQFKEGKLPFLAFFTRKVAGELLQQQGAGVGDGVDGVADAIYQSRLVVHFFVQHTGKIGVYLVHTGPVADVLLQVVEHSLLKNISMVFQNVYLFRDTIRNNIKFGSPDASEEQMIAAAKEARCHDFIMALPDGYDTVIGEGGSSLSGGEKQRISIARAMLKDAPIVILDEATASIDPENEHLIQEAISALTHGKTIITIAHRLATIENADQILVIDGGTVVQKGTHKELLAQRGTYQEFIKIREQAEGWRIQQ